MADTYTQIHIQIIFSVKGWQSLIGDDWRDELFKYITGIIQKNGHKMLAINGMPDHLHILIGLRPSQSLSNLVQDIKGDSSKWINGRHFLRTKFSWQESFGTFSYSKSHISRVIRYIQNQQEHHRKKDFITEYKEFLQKFGIEFKEKYLFTPVIDILSQPGQT